MDFSRERIIENFSYDENTGNIHRKSSGKLMQSKDRDGYITISHCINGNNKRMRASRLVWVMHNGDIPDGMLIDHINRSRDDNRIENLRLVYPSQNAANTFNEQLGTSKYKGVTQDKHGRWRSCISRDNKVVAYEYFDCERAAAYFFNVKAMELNGEYAYLNDVEPIDYTQHISKIGRKEITEKRRGLPTNLVILQGHYVLKVKNTTYARFSSSNLEDAIRCVEHFSKTGKVLDMRTNLLKYNKYGLPYGISPCSTGYRASFMLDNKKRIHVGTFKTVLDAQEALYLEQLEAFGHIKRERFEHG